MTAPSKAQTALQALQAENARLMTLLRGAGIDPDEPGPSAVAAPEPAPVPPALRRPLLQQESFVRLLLDSIAEGFYALDREGRTTLCNPAFLRLLGFDHQDEVLGKRLHPLIHHSYPDGSPYPEEVCPICRAARDGTSKTVWTEVFFRRDGSPMHVEYRAQPVLRNGELQGAICTFFDITERLRSEESLQQSEEQLALALAAAGIGIWDYAPATGELRWDDRVCELFGLSAGREITLETKLAALHPADRPVVEKAFADALKPSGPARYDVSFRTIGIEDGKERWVSAKGHSTAASNGAQRLVGTIRDISEEKRSELHLRLMVNELNHRVKNSLAIVQSIAAQTFRSTHDLETARTAFTERLVALAKAHDVLTATNWEGADLRSVVEEAVALHPGDGGDRVSVEGGAVGLSPKLALAFAMALHELATNALKYGALSNETGHIAIAWRTDAEPAGPRLRFSWRESGGPVVVLPQRRGFGSKLIERGLASELQGDVRIEFREAGVTCTIDAPLPVAASGSIRE